MAEVDVEHARQVIKDVYDRVDRNDISETYNAAIRKQSKEFAEKWQAEQAAKEAASKK